MTLKTIMTAVGSAILIIGFVYFSKTDRALLTGTESKTPKNPALAACDEAIVQELGSPIVSTSANRSNEEVLTDPYDLQDTLGHEVDLILECGPLPVLPSSVVSLVDDQVEVLRQGLGDTTLFDAE